MPPAKLSLPDVITMPLTASSANASSIWASKLFKALDGHHVHGFVRDIPSDCGNALSVFGECEVVHLYLPKLGFLVGVSDP